MNDVKIFVFFDGFRSCMQKKIEKENKSREFIEMKTEI